MSTSDSWALPLPELRRGPKWWKPHDQEGKTRYTGYTHTIHGHGYIHLHLVDSYSKLVGKYGISMDPYWDVLTLRTFCFFRLRMNWPCTYQIYFGTTPSEWWIFWINIWENRFKFFKKQISWLQKYGINQRQSPQKIFGPKTLDPETIGNTKNRWWWHPEVSGFSKNRWVFLTPQDILGGFLGQLQLPEEFLGSHRVFDFCGLAFDS